MGVMIVLGLPTTYDGDCYVIKILEVEEFDNPSNRGFEVSIQFENERLPERTHPGLFIRFDEAEKHAKALMECVESANVTYGVIKKRLISNMQISFRQIKNRLFRNVCKKLFDMNEYKINGERNIMN